MLAHFLFIHFNLRSCTHSVFLNPISLNMPQSLSEIIINHNIIDIVIKEDHERVYVESLIKAYLNDLYKMLEYQGLCMLTGVKME